MITKLSSNQLLEKLTSRELQNLTLEVKETLTNNDKKENASIFSSADLWNIQRRRKNISSRRFL